MRPLRARGAPMTVDHCICGHARHKHLRPTNGGCTVISVTGPPADHPAREHDHGGRTETPCPCVGFTTDRNGHTVI